jgi:hypothetical protein
LFQFEGALGSLKKLAHGSKGYLNQIVNKISLQIDLANKKNKFATPKNNDIKLLRPFNKRSLSENETQLLKTIFFVKKNSNDIISSRRIMINCSVFHSKAYNRRLNSNSYTVCFYSIKNELKYGEITEFFEYESNHFVVISVFDQSDNIKSLPEKCPGYFYKTFKTLFDKFYVLVDTSPTKCVLEIIQADRIRNKYILIHDKSLTYVTRIEYDYEHD